MTDATFVNLLIHRCTVQRAGQLVSSEGTYGHTEENYAQPSLVAPNLRCRFRPLSTDEMVRLGMTSTTIGTYALYLLIRDLPPTLSMIQGLSNHQVVNVRARSGRVIDPGPFDITSVMEPAAAEHHVKMLLSRVT